MYPFLIIITMVDLKRKFSKKRDNDPPALGNYINWHFQENNIKKKEVSDFLGVLPTTLNQYFKQSSFQVAILWRISIAVKHNFFMELGERLKIPFETIKEKELAKQLLEKEKEIENLKIQLGVYKGIHKVE